MEYVKKEELIKGEVYKNSDLDTIFKTHQNKSPSGIGFRISNSRFTKNNYFSGNNTYLITTSEEKHWLNECIKQDKFITFEEAIKTFIPEYVRCTDTHGWKQTILENGGNLIFRSDFKSTCAIQITDSLKDKDTVFKPSTKEAYDAQFVVKEPEFVLPEKWCIKVTNESKPYIKKYRESIDYQPYNIGNYEYQTQQCGHNHISGKELTLEQFKKYVLKEEIVEEKVIEPLPQFKVIKTIETITKVENNEGNQFFIGDKVKLSSINYQSIKGFKYNEDKTKILAILETLDVDINEIEHYIESKVEFILPKKWCITTTIENQNIIFDWLEKNTDWKGRRSGIDVSIGNHYCIEGKKCNGWLYYAPQHKSGYKELTFEEFKKYVLNENN